MKLLLLFISLLVAQTTGFLASSSINIDASSRSLELAAFNNLFAAFNSVKNTARPSRARDLMQSMIENEKCFSTESGARALADVCADNVVYEDRFEAEPFVGKMAVTQYLMDKVAKRQGKGEVRMDRITDGDNACGYLWTWTSGDEEGLRGTTFVQLDDEGQIELMSEFPEPLYKPGDLTKDLLKALTAGSEWKEFQPFEKKQPTVANELVKYLFEDLQSGEPEESREYMMQFWSEGVVYHDFNFVEPMQGPAEVRQFTEEFSFPGIDFRPIRYDDGVDSACFTWECVLGDAPEAIKGISFYELDPETRQIVYVRDIAESAIKPPVLGNLARQLRPGLGVFSGVPAGSRTT